MNKIVLRKVSKNYFEHRNKKRAPKGAIPGRGNPVLEEIDLSIADGAFVCILGPSGCGKSTLIRMIAGFESPSSGAILVDGEPVEGPRPRHVFVFQEDGLFPWMTARENVALGARMMTDRTQARSRVEEYLDLVGLAGFEDHYPHELSGGMRRRAEVARALITNPEVLYLDEPFGALDFVTRMQMREEMLNVKGMFPMTILFITHDIDEAIQLGDQIVVLGERPGRIKADIPVDHPHPRDITKGELAELRNRIHFLMGLHAAL